jgi:ATP-dependent DNA ligase
MKTWEYPSSSGPGTYVTTLADDGLLSCNCRGFLIKKADKPRYCRHTDDVAKKLGLNIVQRGDYQYAIDGNTVQGELIPQVDHGANYQSAKDRGYVNPMLASAPTKGQKISDFDPELFVMEEKYDGERKIVAGHKGDIFVWSRPRSGKGEVGKEDTLPPHLETVFKMLAKLFDFTMDGEVIVPGATKSWDVANLANRDKLCFVAFDFLKLSGTELMQQPYTIRRKLLEQALTAIKFPDGNACVYVGPIFEPLETEVQKIWDRGGEGAIIKRKTSTYRPGWRCPDWLKVKLKMPATLEIIGYTKGKNGPYSSVNLRDSDGIETRVKTKDNATLAAIAKDPSGWIGKRLVIEYQGRTPDKSYRHPMWDHLAGDGE